MTVLEHPEEEVLPEKLSPETGRRPLRPEWILAIIAGGAALLLVFALILTKPLGIGIITTGAKATTRSYRPCSSTPLHSNILI